jgi:hypothetical protein
MLLQEHYSRSLFIKFPAKTAVGDRGLSACEVVRGFIKNMLRSARSQQSEQKIRSEVKEIQKTLFCNLYV